MAMKTTEMEKSQGNNALLGDAAILEQWKAVNAFVSKAIRIKVGVDPLCHYYILQA